MMITPSFHHGFGNERTLSNFLQPEMTTNSVTSRVDPHFLEGAQPVYNYTSSTICSSTTVPVNQNEFYRPNNTAGNIDLKTNNPPKMYLYNPASQMTTPGLPANHHVNRIEHQSHYQNCDFEAKNKREAWLPSCSQPSRYPYDPNYHQQYSFNPRYGGVDFDESVRRKNATRESTNTLKAWLQEHKKNPYPTKGEKIMLAIITKMTLTQVSTWFANARRRLKKENKMTWVPKNRSSDSNNNSNSKKAEDDDDEIVLPDSIESSVKSDNEVSEKFVLAEDTSNDEVEYTEGLPPNQNTSSFTSLFSNITPQSCQTMSMGYRSHPGFVTSAVHQNDGRNFFLNGVNSTAPSAVKSMPNEMSFGTSRSVMQDCSATIPANSCTSPEIAPLQSCKPDSNRYVANLSSVNESASQLFTNTLYSEMIANREAINPSMAFQTKPETFNKSPDRMNNFYSDSNVMPQMELRNSTLENQVQVLPQFTGSAKSSNSINQQYSSYPAYKLPPSNTSSPQQSLTPSFSSEKDFCSELQLSRVSSNQSIQFQQYC